MTLHEFTKVGGLKCSVDLIAVVFIERLNETTTAITADVTYQVDVPYADVKAVIDELDYAQFGEYVKTGNGKTVYVNQAAVMMYDAVSATSTRLVFGPNLAVQINVAYATFKTTLTTVGALGMLAATEFGEPVEFVNGAGAQTGPLSFLLDRETPNLGTLTVRTNGALPTNITCPTITVDNDASSATITFAYTGSGATVGDHPVTIQFLSDGVVILTKIVNVNVASS